MQEKSPWAQLPIGHRVVVRRRVISEGRVEFYDVKGTLMEIRPDGLSLEPERTPTGELAEAPQPLWFMPNSEIAAAKAIPPRRAARRTVQ